MTGILLALGAAVGWGLADYAGGRASRAAPAFRVLWLTQLLGLVLAAAAAALFGLPRPVVLELVAASASGVALAAALAALYRGMVVAPIGVVAPIASASAVIPVVYGLVRGDHASILVAVGMVIAGAGVIFTCTSPAQRAATGRSLIDGVGLALLAAVAGGVTSIGLKLASTTGVLWVLIAQRATVAAVAWTAARHTAPRNRAGAAPWRLIALIGIADVAATGLYTLAFRHGTISTIAVAGSLYPVVTVALAALLLHERLPARQRFGAATAIAGVVAIAAGTH